MKKRVTALLLVCSLFFMGACQNESTSDNQVNAKESTQEEQKYLFESETVKVIETNGWKENETQSVEGNLVFENDHVKAIISEVSNEKSLEEIKAELIASLGSVEPIDDSDQHFSVKSLRKESIRTDVYLNRGEEYTGIIIFMTRNDDYDQNKSAIEKFKSHVEFN